MGEKQVDVKNDLERGKTVEQEQNVDRAEIILSPENLLTTNSPDKRDNNENIIAPETQSGNHNAEYVQQEAALNDNQSPSDNEQELDDDIIEPKRPRAATRTLVRKPLPQPAEDNIGTNEALSHLTQETLLPLDVLQEKANMIKSIVKANVSPVNGEWVDSDESAAHDYNLLRSQTDEIVEELKGNRLFIKAKAN